ncbi:GreA/GreB family elongation factor [Mycobacterium scrofulaceum]|uniref:Transcription elongation factor GreA n=1 Tax=Mycobacterium scrofulaceum TaxID=1783 RepID=A0A1X0KJM5_MYCSC|nr:GreA/GreB family elongation factor [Mycobacterium scrofulaceum]ORB75316.1 transcription elongation factor GreA [Mycobacterium scrofulaceum]
MTSISITPRHYRRLQDELNALRSRRSVEVPDDYLDYGANRGARPSARQRRIREIEHLLGCAAVRDDPAGNRVAEPGAVLTIRYDATGETETLLLGRRGAEDADIKVYSMASPLGRSIAGARPGEQRIYAIPHETGRLVTLLEAVPHRGPSSSGRPDRRPSTPNAA